jgi:hypothetical protein
MSKTGDPFLSITGHYITALPDRPNAWALKTQQLAFTPFEGHHSGSNMSKVIVRTLDHYDICEKVFSRIYLYIFNFTDTGIL